MADFLVSDDERDEIENQVPSFAADLREAKAEQAAAKAAEQAKKPLIDQAFETDTGAWLTNAVDAATGGGARVMGGLRKALQEMGADVGEALGMKGQREDDPSLGEAFGAGWKENTDLINEITGDMGLGGKLSSEIAGALTPGGIYSKADDVIRSLARFAPRTRDKIAKYAMNTTSNFVTGSWDAYARGDMSLEDAMQQGVVDAAFGNAIQYVGGDLLAPNAKRLWNTITGGGKAYPAGAIAKGGAFSMSKPMDEQGITLNGLWDLANRGTIPEGTRLLDLEVGGDTKADMARQVHNAMAKLVFNTPDARNVNTAAGKKAMKMYRELAQEFDRVFQEANDEYRETVTTQLGSWADEFAAVKGALPDSNRVAQVYQDIGQEVDPATGQRLAGATLVNAAEMVDRNKARFAREMGKLDVANLSNSSQKVWKQYKDLLRDVVEEEYAKGTRLKSTYNAQTKEGQEVFSEIPLAKLVDARKELAASITPGAMIDGNSVNKLEVKSAMKLLKMMDEDIAAVAGDKYGVAKDAFAQSRRVEEMHALGQKFYEQRGINANDPKKFQQFYNESIEEIKEELGANSPEWKAFQTGYKRGMHNLVEERGVGAELTEFLGKATDKAYEEKGKGVRELDIVFGKDSAEAIRKLQTEGKERIDIASSLKDLELVKDMNPKEQAEFIGAATKWAQSGGPASMTESHNTLSAQLALLEKIAKTPFEKSKIRNMQKILTLDGQDLSDFIRSSVEAVSPGPSQIGSRAGAAAGGSIQEYLDSVAQEQSQ